MLTMDAQEARKNASARLSLSAMLGDEFEVERLYSGDFAALDTPLSLGIERKSFPNLVQSLASNELDEQLAKMLSLYDVSALLIEGLPTPRGDGKVRVHGAKKDYAYAWILGSVFAWGMRGVIPIFVEKAKGTPLAVATLYGVVKKPDHRETYSPKRVLANLRRMTLPERVMLQFPGVGEKRVKEFRGIAPAVLGVEMVEWWQERLGKVTGRKVWEAWRENSS